MNSLLVNMNMMPQEMNAFLKSDILWIELIEFTGKYRCCNLRCFFLRYLAVNTQVKKGGHYSNWVAFERAWEGVIGRGMPKLDCWRISSCMKTSSYLCHASSLMPFKLVPWILPFHWLMDLKAVTTTFHFRQWAGDTPWWGHISTFEWTNRRRERAWRLYWPASCNQ